MHFNPAKPIVLGCMYTPRAKPPVTDNQGNHCKVFTTKSGSRIIMDDTDGNERIMLYTKDGAMRLVLHKSGGISALSAVNLPLKPVMLPTFNSQKQPPLLAIRTNAL